MGKRGPRKTPTETLKIRGSWLAKHRADVTGAEGVPECPEHFEGEARACWDRTVPLIAEMRVLRKCDYAVLVRYCELWAQWVQAAEFTRANGDTYSTLDSNGNTIHRERIESKKCRELSVVLLRIECEFGLTASARASLKPEAPPSAGISAFARKRG